MATETALDESDSRTSSVGRKRNLQQSIGNVEEISHSPASDSDGEQSSNRSHKRYKRNGGGTDLNDSIPQEAQALENGDEVNQNTAIKNPKDVAASAMSWNKGIQATVRTSLGSSNIVTRKTVLKESPITQKPKEVPDNEIQQHILDDTPAPSLREPPQKKAKRTRGSKSQKRALAALDIATSKMLKITDADILENTHQGSAPGNTSEDVEGKNLVFPAPIEKRAKEKPAAFIIRDLKINFVPQLLINNNNVLSKMNQNSILSACEAYASKNYNRHEQKLASKQLKDPSFQGYCRNRLKDAQAGMISASKLVSTASSINGQDVDDSSNRIPSVSAPVGPDHSRVAVEPTGITQLSSVSNEGEYQGEKSQPSFLGRLLGKKRRASIVATSTAETAAKEMQRSPDDYSPQPETEIMTPSERAPDQSEGVNIVVGGEVVDPQKRPPDQEIKQISGETEAFLINKYYPGLSHGPAAIRCLTCGDNGHRSTSCPQLKCSTCGVHGVHFTNSCPKTLRCSKCRQRGHQKSDCPEKLALIEPEGETCDICGSVHHTEQSCHFLWRSFKPDIGSVRKVRNILVDCYNCGADGHFGPECALSRGTLLTGGYTWSMANRDRYIDPATTLCAISIGRDYLPAKTQNGFSIKGSAKSNPVSIDDSDEENFIRPKIPPPQPKSHIRFGGRQSLEDRSRHQPPPPPRYPPPPPPNSYRPNDEFSRYRRERSFSPPPRYPEGRYDDQYHNFDRNNGYRSPGRPLSPFRGSGARQGSSKPLSRGGRDFNNGGPLENHNVPPPQSLAGKKGGRGGSRGRGNASRGGGGRGAANRGKK